MGSIGPLLQLGASAMHIGAPPVPAMPPLPAVPPEPPLPAVPPEPPVPPSPLKQRTWTGQLSMQLENSSSETNASMTSVPTDVHL
ncbi:MAG: hypothetical protein EX268_12210 [Deltaproteobacteria bacterium]|nr:MAG: hypothetical protein EX268_12210 [Deltaproteobacteria bacterium]